MINGSTRELDSDNGGTGRLGHVIDSPQYNSSNVNLILFTIETTRDL